MPVFVLERYRVVRHEYPRSLDEITPNFMEKVPQDILGQEFRYRRNKKQFLLYSPGWDQVDGGGKSGKNAQGVYDAYSGDWVWPEMK
jgi:hypothetical protein